MTGPEVVSPYDFTTSSLFLLRIAGLSYSDVEPLMSPRSAAWANRVLGLERRLAVASDSLVAKLGAEVGKTEDRIVRHALLAVRRNVHNLRRPSPASLEQARVTLDATVSDWLANLAEYESVRADGARVVADELDFARTRLRDLGRDPRIRKGIQLAAPILEAALNPYLETSTTERSSKRHRGVERSLVNYVFRAAFKTSPFSTFTRICLGRFGQGGGMLDIDVDVVAFQEHATVNLAILGSLTQTALLSQDLRRALPVTLTPGWSIEGDRIRYTRRQYGYHSAPTAPTAGILEEVDFSLPAGEILSETIDIMRREPALTLEQLSDLLHAKDPSGRPRDQLATYTDRLFDLGLVVAPNLRIDPHSARPAKDFGDRLGDLATEDGARISEHVGRLVAGAGQYGSAEVRRRAEILAEASSESRTVFYADTVATAMASADDSWWRTELVPQLERIATTLPAFDALTLDRLLLKGYFRDRFGRGGTCDDVRSFAHEAQRVCPKWTSAYARSGLTDKDIENAPFAREDLATLRDARALFETAVRDQCATPTDEVVIDGQVLNAVQERLMELRPAVVPVSFYLQPAGREDGWRCALNLAHTGLGMSTARFGYPLERATGHPVSAWLRQQAIDVRPESGVLAEMSGGYDATNLSWHPPIAPYQIVGPGEVSFRPRDEQLPIDDLVLIDDPTRNELRLHSRRLGLPVLPVYLSSLVPVALPEVQRTLLALSCSTMPNLGFEAWLTGRRTGTAEAFPAVRHDDIVLRRRSWSMSPTDFPVGERNPEDLILAWRRWWRKHRLPTEMFFSIPARRGGLQAHLAEKPRYVNVDSTLSLLAFTHSVRSAAEPVRMTEMLPRPHESVLAGGPGYTGEICVEITGTRKGPP